MRASTPPGSIAVTNQVETGGLNGTLAKVTVLPEDDWNFAAGIGPT
jgi:hypothetical protein